LTKDVFAVTEKTHLINLHFVIVRSSYSIALIVALSDIAATLLDEEKEAHLLFKLTLNIKAIEIPTCNINKQSNWQKC